MRNHIFTELNRIVGKFIIIVLEVVEDSDMDVASHAPKRVATKGSIFSEGARTGWE